MYVGDKVNHRIIQYTLTTPYNVSTLLYARELSVSGRGSVQAITFNADGSKMYVLDNLGNAEGGTAGGRIDEYAMGTNFDVMTATITDSFDVSTQDANMQDIFFNNVARGAVNPGGLLFAVGDRRFSPDPIHLSLFQCFAKKSLIFWQQKTFVHKKVD